MVITRDTTEQAWPINGTPVVEQGCSVLTVLLVRRLHGSRPDRFQNEISPTIELDPEPVRSGGTRTEQPWVVEGVQNRVFMTVTEEILDEITRRIVHAFDPEKVVLFGSYAYGEPYPDSDVDLLVVMETEMQPTERSVAISELIRPRPFPIDIIAKTPKELENSLAQGNFFLNEILEQGKVLYEISKCL